MNKFQIAAAVALSVAAGSLAFAQTDHDAHGQGQATGEISGASKAYMDAMAAMNRDMEAMTMTGKPGVDFVLMMIPHHQSAVDMAEAYLASGENDPELTRLSNEIIASQKGEIDFMKAWLEKNGR